MSVLPKIWQRHFLLVEFLLSILVAVAFAVWLYKYCGHVYVDDILSGSRSSIYGAVASILGSLLGFAITATSIVLGFSVSEKLTVLRESSEYPKLWQTFVSTIWALGLATVFALACMLFDKDATPVRWLLVVFIWCIVFAVFRIARTIWALEHIIALVTKK
jgi:mannose/fructose/N-acetylgalactosamine-specific phosphotransferase system component IID